VRRSRRLRLRRARNRVEVVDTAVRMECAAQGDCDIGGIKPDMVHVIQGPNGVRRSRRLRRHLLALELVALDCSSEWSAPLKAIATTLRLALDYRWGSDSPNGVRRSRRLRHSYLIRSQSANR